MLGPVVRYLPPLGLAASLLIAWQSYVRLAQVPPTLLPAPSDIVTGSLQSADVLAVHATQTLVETIAGFVLAVLVAAAVAAATDLSQLVKRALLPLLIASQTVPMVALAPLLVLWFGFGMLPKVLVVALVCFFPIVVASAHGLAATDVELIKLYRTFGATRRHIFFRVRVPTALPSVFAGLRIAVTYSVVGAIFGEYAGAFQGLGVLLQTTKNAYRTDLMFGTIVVTATLSLCLYGFVTLLERLLIPWSIVPEGDRQWRGAAGNPTS
ncbi:MAG: ABC transporter permease [Chloroflexi bacterium]|nr:ABC transporter permease [Chloroflexota bacterium]